MKKGNRFWRRLISGIVSVLILAMCSTAVCFAEDEQAADENAAVDFVLVLDCSGSLKTTDPHYLCSTACKMFLDMVPLENARIGIIAFGYSDGTQYTLQSRSVSNPLDLKKVHLVSPLQEASAIREKEGIKDTIDSVVQKAGDKTPIGTATLAAIDLLENSGSVNGNACVILRTDGS